MEPTKFYNGNPQIKKAGVVQTFTKEQIDEYIKCSSDPIYFIKNYIKIISLDHGLVRFDLWPYQERMIHGFLDNRFSICLLPRQMGKTVVVAAYLLHYTIFNPYRSVGILANKGAIAREILARIKRMIENLPFFLQPGIEEYNKGSVGFGNGSTILASATSNDAIRGHSFNCVYLDEFAFVENADTFYTSTYPVISSGENTKIIITSTPNGMNLFYKLWMDAKNKRNNFTPIHVHWSEHPRRDEAWKVKTLADIGLLKFTQEYECAFHGSSNTLISGQKLAELTWEEPIEATDKIKIWEMPEPEHIYVLIGDVGEGVGLDSSVAHILDITETPYKQVMMYRDNTTGPVEFAEVCNRLAAKYNEAHVLIETNSIGSQVGYLLYHDYEYENVIIADTVGQNNKITGASSKNPEYGLRMTKKSKRLGCSRLKSLIENQILLIRDFDTISELETFVKVRDSYEAEEGKNDDIAMTLVVFAWMTLQEFFQDIKETNINQQILDRHKDQIEGEMVPFGFITDGIDELEQQEEFISHQGIPVNW